MPSTITRQEKDQIVRDIKNIFERLKVVHTCDHKPEVEVRYDEYKIFRHTMCRACWNHETYHKINKDSVQVIRPNQLGVTIARCLNCNSVMSECRCSDA